MNRGYVPCPRPRPRIPRRQRNPLGPINPCRALWKTEPEEDDGEIPLEPERPGAITALGRQVRSTRGFIEVISASNVPSSTSKAPSSTSRAPSSKSKKAKSAAPQEDKKGKKVLLEDTPALDTIESRQRARLIMGALIAICVLLPCWITYRVFLYDPSPIEVTDDHGAAAKSSPEFRPNLDQEAQFMYNQATSKPSTGTRTGPSPC